MTSHIPHDPAAPTGVPAHLPPAGWFTHPYDQTVRWWNGSAWTDHRPPAAPPTGYGSASAPPSPGHGPDPAAVRPIDEREARNWSMWAHLGPVLVGIAGLLTAGLLSLFAFVVPLIIKETAGSRSEQVRAFAVESLNFALSELIYALCLIVLTLVTFGFGLIIVIPVGIAFLVLRIVAAVKASRGEFFRYPLAIRFIK